MSDRNFKILLIITGVGIVFAHLFFYNNDTHKPHAGNGEELKEVVSTNSVAIKSYAYSPQKIKIKKGTTVTWENQDLVPHTITKSKNSKTGPDSKLFGKGEKNSFTFSEVGVYDYYCKPHPYMKGTVEVTE